MKSPHEKCYTNLVWAHYVQGILMGAFELESVIERILDGQFNTDNKSLVFSVPVIELTISEGEIYEGSFTIFGVKDELTEGVVSSSDLRMQCPVENFSGQESEIPYIFDPAGLSEGDCTKGEFKIVSNQGEYILPYDIHIDRNKPDTSLGNIKNLFHFTNLARTNWKEAVELFASDDFENILGGAELQYRSVYHALKTSANKEQSLEEFLLYVKKKQLAEFLIAEPNVRIENIYSDAEKTILISRNGWGYSELKVESEDDFIEIANPNITQDDFIGNAARFSYTILADKLHEGRNFGSIRISNAYNDIVIGVTVIKNAINRKVADMNRNYNHNILELMQYYEAFRLRKVSMQSWMESTLRVIDKLKELNPDDINAQLMHVQLLITQERYNEARWVLEQYENQVASTDDPVIYGYYYYLTTLIDKSMANIDQVTQMIERLYEKYSDCWQLGWFLLYLSEDYTMSLQKKWEFLENLYEKGAKSPALYIEAVQILNANPTFINELKSYEISLLRYMAKKEVLTSEIIDQFLNQLGRYSTYDKRLFNLLTECYKILPSDEILQRIVSMLIKLGRNDSTAFSWYEKAIEKNLRITKLYESYMMSMDIDSNPDIPKMVLMYFAFDSTLDIMHNAYLYSYVYKNRGIYPELFDNYREAIERFTMTQLLKGHSNKYLAYLYRNMVTENLISEDIAKGLVRALFVHRIVPVRKEIASVAVFYENVTTPVEYVIRNEKEIYIPLYGSNYQIVLIDKNRNRFLCDSEYRVERLMVPDKLAGYIAKDVSDELFFNLWVCEDGKDIGRITDDNVNSMRYLSKSEIITDRVKNYINSNLIGFYYDTDRIEELDSLLEDLTIDDVPAKSVTNVIHYMMLRGKYEKAYEWICRCGSENIDASVVVRLCNRLVRTEQTLNGDMTENPTLTSLLYKAFTKNKYDDASITYLARYYQGTTKDLRAIFKAAGEFGIDTEELEERALLQQLYTNTFNPGMTPIFVSYSRRNKNIDLVKAYIAQVCFDYFVNEKIIEEDYFEVLEKLIDDGVDISLSCKLAYTKKWSEKVRDIDERVTRVLIVFLKEILNAGMYFPYFREFAQSITYMHRFADKTMIEYRIKENSSATIHYMIEKSGESDGEYLHEEMKEMYHGICVKSLVLFFGERLSYYIIEHNDGEDVLTESKTYSQNDLDAHEGLGRYNMITDVAISRTLNDRPAMEALLVEYFKNEYLLQTLFSPII